MFIELIIITSLSHTYNDSEKTVSQQDDRNFNNRLKSLFFIKTTGKKAVWIMLFARILKNVCKFHLSFQTNI